MKANVNNRSGSRHQPEQTRSAILAAAVQEFAAEGLSGARTERIAQAAGVNKALLYYYFADKEALYGAVLNQVFTGLQTSLEQALDQAGRPTERLLAYVGAHFDYIASSPEYPRLVQREMMRVERNSSLHIERIVKRYFRPIYTKVAGVIREGITAGEFRAVDPMQFIPSMIAVIVFYFGAAPVMRAVLERDPLSPEMVAHRRAAVLDFVSSALLSRAANGTMTETHSGPPKSRTEALQHSPVARGRSQHGITTRRGAR